jgi:DegV family protein with EDD domain
MSRVAVVTDSTSYLPAQLVRECDIAVVPLQVVIGGKAYDEGGETSSATVAQALRSWTPVTTSRPGPAAFTDAYERAAERGCDGVVSIHLSSKMSGTVESAELAAKESPVRVEVVDSRSLGMGLGFAVLAAARPPWAAVVGRRGVAAREPHDGRDLRRHLEHLRGGGRIGPAAALTGSAL